MKLGALGCMVMGHKWHVDESVTDSQARLLCSRCGRRQLPPTDSGFSARVRVETDRARKVGR